jgi:predicted transcriptional regulator
MIRDGRVRELRRLLSMGRTLGDSARMAEMSEKSARKYRDSNGLAR